MLDQKKDKHKIMVALNGATRGKHDHPNLPITKEEICAEAVQCLEAGAHALHLHVRDENGQHVLDADLYKETLSALGDVVGPNLLIQITTEAVGKYTPQEQCQVVYDVRPQAVSVAVRELIPDAMHEKEAEDLFYWMAAEHVEPQYIMYHPDDLNQFWDLQDRGVIPRFHNSVLFVLGDKKTKDNAHPSQLKNYLDLGLEDLDWWVCAFGEKEADCALEAFKNGGHARIGFENNLYLPGGKLAQNNAELVKNLKNMMKEQGL